MSTGLRQLTVDHSEVQELLDRGDITPDQAVSHPHRHVITRAVGSRPTPTVDTWMLPFADGTTYLLCSDGLTNELSTESIEALMRSSHTPQMAADRLVEAAELAGGRDNITVVVVRVEGEAATGHGGTEGAEGDDTVPSSPLEGTTP